jgi:prepilin peptidase CpaA
MLMLATATVTDLLWNRITNWTTYTAFAWAVGLNVVNELFPASREVLGGVGLVQSLLGGLFAFALFLAVFSITGGGAGDVKLMTCVGALLGPSASFDVAIYSFLVGGVVLFAYSAWIHGPGLLLGSMLRLAGSTFFPLWISPLSEEQKGLMKSPVPLGPFFAAGTMIHLFQDVIGPWF